VSGIGATRPCNVMDRISRLVMARISPLVMVRLVRTTSRGTVLVQVARTSRAMTLNGRAMTGLNGRAMTGLNGQAMTSKAAEFLL